MSLLCVTIKKARLLGGIDEFNTYVTVKLQNVKSTTVAVKGNQPCWEQEFIFETNRLDDGMMLELWGKGVLWDKLLGVHWMPLSSVQYSVAPGEGKWLQIDQELETRSGQTVGTSRPTGHSLLVDVRFELPFDAQTGDAAELQAKLQALNSLIENDHMLPNHRAPFTHSGISEDSDYTSDVSFPIHHHQQQANSSAHQWDSHLHPHRTQHRHAPDRASYEDEEDAYQNEHYPQESHLQYPDDSHLAYDEYGQPYPDDEDARFSSPMASGHHPYDDEDMDRRYGEDDYDHAQYDHDAYHQDDNYDYEPEYRELN